LILGDKNVITQTQRKLENNSKKMNLSLLSQLEPKFFIESHNDHHWVNAMEEELNQIEKNETQELVPRPKDKNVIRTKCVLKKKLKEHGKVVRN
jgi:hypothetical protein